MVTDKQRKRGQFYTPKLFADYAHQMISNTFGADWREKYVVWDNCAGSKNLTRDYRFKELYSSTLEQAELEISKRYNPEATSFQFDFLNDPLAKLPEGLLKAFEENKPIIFFINPPYATAANRNETSKEGVAKTMIYEEMTKNKVGGASQNLYAQFLYRIVMIKEQYNLTNVHICLFSPTNFLGGGNWKGFRNVFLNNFAFNNAVQFKASHFADVADKWGISFSIWNNGINTNNNDFNYKLIDNIDGEIEVVGEKVVYNIDGQISAGEWVRKELKERSKDEKTSVPHLSSGIIKSATDNQKVYKDFLGCLAIMGNNVNQNAQGITIGSTIMAQGNSHTSLSILPINFTKCTALFSARRLVDGNWINWADEYLAPNEEHPAYKEFVNDSIIYSLFESKSNQSSLRQVEYKGKKWDIFNQFFFMSKNDILELIDNEIKKIDDEEQADKH